MITPRAARPSPREQSETGRGRVRSEGIGRDADQLASSSPVISSILSALEGTSFVDSVRGRRVLGDHGGRHTLPNSEASPPAPRLAPQAATGAVGVGAKGVIHRAERVVASSVFSASQPRPKGKHCAHRRDRQRAQATTRRALLCDIKISLSIATPTL